MHISQSASQQDEVVQQQERIVDLVPAQHHAEQLRLFSEKFGDCHSVIYHPCCHTDIAPSLVFPEARVIYVDCDPDVVATFTLRPDLEFVHADALRYDPKVPLDIVVLMNASAGMDVGCHRLNLGGYFICTERFGLAANMHRDERFQHVAAISPNGEDFEESSKALAEYFQTVETDQELVDRYPAGGFGLQRNLHLYSQHYNVSVEGSLLNRYIDLYVRAKHAMAKLGDPNGPVFGDPTDTSSLLWPLPYKRGSSDTMHAFRKLRD